MNQDGQESGSSKPAGKISDESLRAILGSYSVPEPSKNFVADTLLQVQLDQNKVPEPSAGFVDRVIDAWAEEQSERGASAMPTEELVPIIDLSRHAAPEMIERRSANRFPMVLALVGFAAALVLAFFVGRQSASTDAFSDQALVRIEDFPTRGSNRFARSLSLVVDRVDSNLLGVQPAGSATSQGGPAFPRPVLSLPAPPSSLIPSTAVEIHADQETLESLGVTSNQL